ncbi:hypothetical protein [Duganella callida]|uniref:Uncharacterized protein n=1 Tax=Duganella callida TaxID=2561932 RepID=A0A4Y9S8F2_9BURK|nr:hypothetical protein [Duganella callida]TFW17877.1 hypothetical protein E4L98_19655 [Duganella callida]
MNSHHDSSIGGPGDVDGIRGSRSGTEGATSGQGVDKGARTATQQQDRQAQRQGGPAGSGGEPGGLGGNSSDSRQSAGPGVMETEPRDNKQERRPGP